MVQISPLPRIRVTLLGFEAGTSGAPAVRNTPPNSLALPHASRIAAGLTCEDLIDHDHAPREA